MPHIELHGKPVTSVIARENEVLWDLCRKHTDRHDYDFVLAVQRLNEMSDPNAVQTDQVIRLPEPLSEAIDFECASTETDSLMWGAVLNFMHSNGSSDDVTLSAVGQFSRVVGRVQRARAFLERHPLYPEQKGSFEFALEFTHRGSGRQFDLVDLGPERRDRYTNYEIKWDALKVPAEYVPESLRRHLMAFVTEGQWAPLFQPLSELIG